MPARDIRTWAFWRPPREMRLFCLAHAGASARTFLGWDTGLPDFVKTRPVELPGHGARLDEPPQERLAPLVDQLLAKLAPELADPFGIFGHSLGALIGWELARRLQQQGLPAPRLLLVSGMNPPDVISSAEPAHLLSDKKLIARLRQNGGTPAEVLDDAELMGLFLPALRADLTITDTYRYLPGPVLRCPIVAFGSLDDPSRRGSLDGWRRQTRGPFAAHMVPGDHFFLLTSRDLLLRKISDALRSHCWSLTQDVSGCPPLL